MSRAWGLYAATVALTVVAGVIHYAVGNDAGTLASAVPLILVAPLIAIGCDGLAPRLSASLLGIVQSAFGNAAELALTIVALADGLPDVVRFALAGSILGNAIFLGGVAGLMPFVRRRGRELEPLRFDRQLFTGITTLSFISVLPIALLSFPSSFSRNVQNDETVSLAAGIALLVAGAFFIYSELRRPHRPIRSADATAAAAAHHAVCRRALPGHGRRGGRTDLGLVRGRVRAGHRAPRHPRGLRQPDHHPVPRQRGRELRRPALCLARPG